MILALLLAACAPAASEVVEVEVTREVEVEVEVVKEVEVMPEVGERALRLVSGEDWGGAESLDPASPSRDVPSINLLYSQLIRLDEKNKAIPTPDLIESWESTADGLTWTFHVRQGVTFHDGTPMTADDIIYTLRHVVDPDLGSPAAAALDIVDVAHLSAPDEYTVILPLKSGHSDLPLLLTDYRLRVIAEGSADDPDSPNHIQNTGNGTGPFMLDTFSLDGITVMVANPNYWEGPPGVNRIEISRISDTDAWIRALLADQIDFLDSGGVSVENIPLFEGTDEYVVQRNPTGNWQDFVMNVNVPPFDDVRVRQAMKLVVDRAEMMEFVLERVMHIGVVIESGDDQKSLPQ